MDEQAIEALGTKPLAPYLAAIRKIKDVRSLQAALTQMEKIGFGGIFGAGGMDERRNAQAGA